MEKIVSNKDVGAQYANRQVERDAQEIADGYVNSSADDDYIAAKPTQLPNHTQAEIESANPGKAKKPRAVDTEKVSKQLVRETVEGVLPDQAPTVATRDTNPVTSEGLLAPQAVTNRVL